MNKWKTVLLLIITFGFYWFFKPKIKQSNNLSVAKKNPFNTKNLLQLLGTENNIKNVQSTFNKVKINIVDIKKIDKPGLRKFLNKTGILLTSKTVILVVGNSAKLIAEDLNKKLNSK